MVEFEFPCPKCGEPLISDQETAGTEAICPYCDNLIEMPEPPAPQPSETSSEPAPRRRSRIPKQRQLGELPQGKGRQKRDVEAQDSHLPSGRDRQSREDLSKLAAIAHGPQTEPLPSAFKGGKVSFHCPGCARLIWIRPRDEGKLVSCPGCNQDVICPAPGEGARLADPEASSPKRRSVLPSQRTGDHVAMDKSSAPLSGDRSSLPSRTRHPSSTIDDSSDQPTRQEQPSSPQPKPKVKPIKKQRDVEISPSQLKRYRAVARERKIQKALTPAEAEAHAKAANPSAANAAPSSSNQKIPSSRRAFPDSGRAGMSPPGTTPELGSGHRLNPDLVPRLDAVGDAELSDEVSADWGATGHPARGSRRLLVLALVLGIPALAAAAFIAFQGDPDPIEGGPSSVESESDRAMREVAEAEQVLKDMLAARTIEERLPFVRHPEETRPRMKIHDTQDHDPLPPVAEFQWAKNGEIDGKRFIWIPVRFLDDNVRTAVFEITTEGPKLDWESFVFFEDPPMSRFVSEQPEEPGVYRVECSVDNYYNNLYEDSSKFLSFYLKGPDRISTCWGYVDINSDIALQFSQLFKEQGVSSYSDGESIKVMLKMHFKKNDEGLSNSQAWIDEIVSGSWVIP